MGFKEISMDFKEFEFVYAYEAIKGFLKFLEIKLKVVVSVEF